MTTTSLRKAETNRQNSLESTGPKTPARKAVSSKNALRHGIFSRLKVLPDVERPEDWEAHVEAVLEDLRPAGYVETTLVERVALILWRLGRVARYERETTALELEAVSRDVGGEMPLLMRVSRYQRPDMIEIADGALIAAEEGRDLACRLRDVSDTESIDSAVAAKMVEVIADLSNVTISSGTGSALPGCPPGSALDQLPWTAGQLRERLAGIID
jgi:hypothetical protein